MQNGESVGAHTLIDELWGESVPRSALTTLQTYIYHARKLCDAGPGGHSVLVTRPAGYSIEVPGDSIDVVVFEGLANQARAALGRGRRRRPPPCSTRRSRSGAARCSPA